MAVQQVHAPGSACALQACPGATAKPLALLQGAAFGLGFVAGPGTADPWSPKVLRAGAGSHFRTTIERAPDLSVDVLQRRGFTLVASVAEGGDSPARLAPLERVALLIGDESSGLTAGVVDAADILVTIPMPGHTESLNAAVAGSLLAYELTRTDTDD